MAILQTTSVKEIEHLLPYLNVILFMAAATPGVGGLKLVPHTLDKIKEAKEYITKNNLNTFIEVDQGINKETAKLAIESGADILVAGSAITNTENFKEAINGLKT